MSRNDKFLRRCIGCYQFKSKNELIKITKDSRTHKIAVNPEKGIYGRSVYICKNESCLENAFKKMKISKFIKQNVNPDVKEIIKTVLDK